MAFLSSSVAADVSYMTSNDGGTMQLTFAGPNGGVGIPAQTGATCPAASICPFVAFSPDGTSIYPISYSTNVVGSAGTTGSVLGVNISLNALPSATLTTLKNSFPGTGNLNTASYTLYYTQTNPQSKEFYPVSSATGSVYNFTASTNALIITLNNVPTFDFTRLQAVITPKASYLLATSTYSITNSSTGGVAKFTINDTAGGLATDALTLSTNGGSILLVYDLNNSYNNVITNSTQDLCEKITAITYAYLSTQADTLPNPLTDAAFAIPSGSMSVAVSNILDQIFSTPNIGFSIDPSSTAYPQARDVMKYVVKQQIFSYCNPSSASPGCNNIHYDTTSSFLATSVDPDAGGIYSGTVNAATAVMCGTDSNGPVYCVPFMRKLSDVNNVLKQDISMLNNQISSVLGVQGIDGQRNQ